MPNSKNMPDQDSDKHNLVPRKGSEILRIYNETVALQQKLTSLSLPHLNVYNHTHLFVHLHNSNFKSSISTFYRICYQECDWLFKIRIANLQE